MSDDNTYRQERKKITPSEVNSVNSISHDDVLKFQQQQGYPVHNSNPGNQQSPIVSDNTPNIQGNVPPALKAFAEMQQNAQNSMPQSVPVSVEQSTPVVVKPTSAPFGLDPSKSAAYDGTLDALLNTLHTQEYDEVVLPSRGKFYSGGGMPNDGLVHIRPMTGQEEAILATERFMRNGTGIERILSSCLKEKFDTTQLLLIDRTFLIIYLRGISYGNIYSVNLHCPKCDSNFEYDIDLNLPVHYCDDGIDESAFVKTLPNSKFKFKYRLLSGRDEKEIERHRKMMSNNFKDNIDDTFFYRAALSLDWIGLDNNLLNNKSEIQSLVQKLPVNDVNYIRNVLLKPPFGSDTLIPTICNVCSADFKIELPFEASFFYPRETTLD